MDVPEKLAKQIEFLLIADRLKHVERLNMTSNGDRRENSAEHSWHTTLQTIVLSTHAPEGIYLDRVIRMLVVHDLVEIYAGDHWVTAENSEAVSKKENAAAEKLFAVLPADQRVEFEMLWEEFSAWETIEARFGHAMDELHPVIMVFGPGASGKLHTELSVSGLKGRKRRKLAEFPALWAFAEQMLDDAHARGILKA
jgi:putative hydrolase of HD superfamily